MHNTAPGAGGVSGEGVFARRAPRPPSPPQAAAQLQQRECGVPLHGGHPRAEEAQRQAAQRAP
eukprot:6546939-Pyramimonas_sp.AAC.1